jgi:tRNA-dihydrouridine synthase 1
MFNETSKFRDNHFQPLRSSLSSHPSPTSTYTPSDLYLDGNPAFDRPLTVQFCANDPDEFLNAARYVAPFCDAVDLNLGCPQGIARKGKYGAFLQEDQDLVFKLIDKLHRELDVPVTAKIRILETKEKTLAYAKKVLEAGASILTVHGRQREQKGHNTGLADWRMIRFLREELGSEVVLFANGNILQREDIERCIEETGADGVMSAEGNLYDPAIFSEPPPVGEEGREYWRGRDGKGGWRMDAVFRRYMDIIYKYVLEVKVPERKSLYLPSDPGESGKLKGDAGEEEGPARKKQKKEKKEKATSPNLLAMQAHSFHLLRALVSKHHNVRDALARCRAGDIEAYENVLQMVEAAVKYGIKEYEETEGMSWEDELARDERLKEVKKDPVPKANGEVDEEIDERYESSLETVKKCKRPWWVVQPYVRPLPKEALAKGSMTLSKKDKAKLGKEDSEVLGGHTVVEKSGVGKEVEIPKEGLVCG